MKKYEYFYYTYFNMKWKFWLSSDGLFSHKLVCFEVFEKVFGIAIEKSFFNPFYVSGLYLYLLKTSENLWLSR